MYWVYIMASTSCVLYIGVTSNIERRVAEHKARTFPGFATRYHCTRPVFVDSFTSVRDAIACEKQLKGWRRAKKVALITRDNPSWIDLAMSED